MKISTFVAGLALVSPAAAQSVQPMQDMYVSASLVFGNIGDGVIDLSHYRIHATAPMQAVVTIAPPTANGAFYCHIKLGIVDAAKLANDAVDISNVQDCKIEIKAAIGAKYSNVWLSSGPYAMFNNHIWIGAISSSGGNGLVLWSPSNDTTYNVQGNHIEVGQIIANAQTGILIGTGAFANNFLVGPIEHNGGYACLDWAGGSGAMVNHWLAVGTNSNGAAGGPC